SAVAALANVTLTNNTGGNTLVNDRPTGPIPGNPSVSHNAGNKASLTTLTTNAATSIGTTSATLHGVVNAQPAGSIANSVTISFQYGTVSGSYPNNMAATPGSSSGNTNTSVSANLSSLNAGTTYFYRVVAVNSATGATSYGNERNFTTF